MAFQEEMVDAHKNRFSICKMPRQVGKTTTTVSYMLWSVLFNADYTVYSRKQSQLAREILGRLQRHMNIYHYGFNKVSSLGIKVI